MKLDKKSIYYRSLKNITTGGAILLFSGVTSFSSLNILLAILVTAGLIASIVTTLIWQYLIWKNYNFFIEKKKIRIESGVLRKQKREIPLRRIQNVDINRNIIHRILDIAEVKLETAGGSTTEASLRYVGSEQAKEIQTTITNLKREEDVEKEEDSKVDEKPIYEITDKELVLLGLTSSGMQIIIGAFVIIGIFGSIMGSMLEEMGAGIVIGLTVVTFIGLMLAWFSSGIQSILKYHDFKLWYSRDSLDYERGLLNRAEGSIPLEKIQKLTVEENPLKRLFGYATLKIETAGYSTEQSMQESKSAIPLAERSRIMEFVDRIEETGEMNIEKLPKKARRRYFGRYMIVSTFLAMTGTMLLLSVGQNPFVGILFLALLTPVSGIAAHYKWKNKGYFIGDDHFVTMNGFWNRKTMAVPFYRIQNLIEYQKIFQRRWGLAGIVFDIAGTNAFQQDAEITDLERETALKIREKSYQKFRESLLQHD